MRLILQNDVPIPPSTGGGDGSGNEITAVIVQMQPGQSFFIPTPDADKRPALQKRIQTYGTQMRQSSRIDFFLVTRRRTEIDPETGLETPGLHVWRRENGVDDLDE